METSFNKLHFVQLPVRYYLLCPSFCHFLSSKQKFLKKGKPFQIPTLCCGGLGGGREWVHFQHGDRSRERKGSSGLRWWKNWAREFFRNKFSSYIFGALPHSKMRPPIMDKEISGVENRAVHTESWRFCHQEKHTWYA
ncbi:hypothetical protein AVEN_252170-1 [Araneus ventricosus]|uniref:Uncharacterized protein n=1 Tax=Araneus ventricosus TaxID=182803 RepID=A0A4Y2PX93_ARAVE|nr:hypothetical protein AVEN_252170-1 [Araneus ventricosus]